MQNLDEIVAEITTHHRYRQDYLRVEGDATRRMRSICWRETGGKRSDGAALYDALKTGDHPMYGQIIGHLQPLLEMRAAVHRQVLMAEKGMKAAVRELPAHILEWVDRTPGFGEIALGQIIGEAGNISNFANRFRLYKRLCVAVIDGQAQRRVADRELAILHGFNPRRRAVLYAITVSLIMKKGNGYHELYHARKAFDAWKLLQDGQPEKRAYAMASKRAHRYVTKRLVEHVYLVWNGADQNRLHFETSQPPADWLAAA